VQVFTSESEGWYVSKLIEATKDLPPREVSVAELLAGDDTQKAVDWLYKNEPYSVEEADLQYPVILSAEGVLMDGYHRLAKAAKDGLKTLPAVQFEVTPPPDFTDP
jgi:hypothetical protein